MCRGNVFLSAQHRDGGVPRPDPLGEAGDRGEGRTGAAESMNSVRIVLAELKRAIPTPLGSTALRRRLRDRLVRR